MNLGQHPQLLDRIAASYALGALRGGARRRFETLARENPRVRAAALLWQGRWSALPELQTPHTPDAAVWIRINNLLQTEKSRAAAQPAPESTTKVELASIRSALAWWRGAAIVGACASAAVLAIGLWSNQNIKQEAGAQLAQLRTEVQTAQAALASAPQIQYVAVLADAKSDASMLVTFDSAHNSLVLQRVGNFQEGQDKSLQLWALPPQGGPRSLGVLGQEKLLKLTAGASQVEAVPALAISLEPKGGVSSETGPTGPVLFKGALIRRDL